MSLPAQASELLDFWFGPDWQNLPAQVVGARQQALWWSKNPQIDAQCRERFGDLMQQAADNRLADWSDDPETLLALVLLLDQMPRNIHRDTAQAFAFDELARQYTHLALAMGVDQALPPIARVFLYLPLEHSEDLDDQQYALQLFRALAKSAAGGDPAQQQAFDQYADFARRHHAIIERFGRFPHRNRLLGRTSTAEEQLFLTQPDSGF